MRPEVLQAANFDNGSASRRGSREPTAPALEGGKMDLRRIDFDSPTEIREFEKGRFEVYEVGPTILGRATYEPGWKWSEHVGATRGERLCQIEHVGVVLASPARPRFGAPDARRRSSRAPPASRCVGACRRDSPSRHRGRRHLERRLR